MTQKTRRVETPSCVTVMQAYVIKLSCEAFMHGETRWGAGRTDDKAGDATIGRNTGDDHIATAHGARL